MKDTEALHVGGIMIFWFSGTGNSFVVAQALAEGLGERIMPISRAIGELPEEVLFLMGKEKRIGFVFPVYAWGPPKMILEFVKRLPHCSQDAGHMPFLFSVSTCGDEEGDATSLLKKALESRGMTLDSAFTLQMPNNYVVGFDIDSPEEQRQKLAKTEKRIHEMLPILEACQKGVFELIPGKMPSLKTTLANPMFNRYAMDSTKFTVSDACTRCGLCEDMCPARNIVRNEGRPVWGNRCTQCLACLHHCPVRAIQFGRGTVRKGRYLHPNAKGMREALLSRDE